MNHQKEAEEILDLPIFDLYNSDSGDVLAAAQINATLAVVEQLRIGNLIQLATRELFEGADDASAAIFDTTGTHWPIRPEIAEALGIEQP